MESVRSVGSWIGRYGVDRWACTRDYMKKKCGQDTLRRVKSLSGLIRPVQVRVWTLGECIRHALFWLVATQSSVRGFLGIVVISGIACLLGVATFEI